MSDSIGLTPNIYTTPSRGNISCSLSVLKLDHIHVKYLNNKLTVDLADATQINDIRKELSTNLVNMNTKLDQSITEISSSSNKLSEDLIALKTSLSADISTNAADITAIKVVNIAQNNAITGLGTRLDKSISDTSTALTTKINTDVTAVKTSLTARIDANATDIADIKLVNTTQTNAITSLGARLDKSIADTSTALTTKINTDVTDVRTTLTARINTNATDITAIKLVNTTQTNDTTNLGIRLDKSIADTSTALTTKINTDVTDVRTTLTARINTNATDIAAIKLVNTTQTDEITTLKNWRTAATTSIDSKVAVVDYTNWVNNTATPVFDAVTNPVLRAAARLAPDATHTAAIYGELLSSFGNPASLTAPVTQLPQGASVPVTLTFTPVQILVVDMNSRFPAAPQTPGAGLYGTTVGYTIPRFYTRPTSIARFLVADTIGPTTGLPPRWQVEVYKSTITFTINSGKFFILVL